MKPGVQSNVSVPVPVDVNVAPVGSAEVVIIGVVPSASVADTVKFRLTPSSVLFEPIEARTGIKLTWLTVIETTSESTAEESSVA
ncbi:MAG: hypothetical protein CVT49_05900 [candidate division Zixibacteria bacterium HGW-Zixibacteria-1]|nr:MAG: hypothetical protein CVT49_05900 [candidate division Zixibacteria bacterium HGW-Zixibacteria-1]